MKVGRSLATMAWATGLSLTTLSARLDAQQLGWNSYLQASCANQACTQIVFLQALTGLQPQATVGANPTAAIIALGNPGYISLLNIQSVGAQFVNGSVQAPGWLSFVVSGNQLLLSFDTNTPYSSAPLTILATMASSAAGQQFVYGGTAHLGAMGQLYNSAGTVVSSNAPGNKYDAGTFNGTGFVETQVLLETATPEPTSLVLLATGFAGLVGVVRRRRPQAS